MGDPQRRQARFSSHSAARYRALRLGGSLSARFMPQADGSLRVLSTEPLRAYPERLTDRLLHWAAVAPDRTLAAKRGVDGQWRHLSYAQALQQARSIAQALLDLGLSAERPVAILSDNDLEHLLLGLGAMLAGLPFAPVSSAYSTVSQDFGKLRHIMSLLTPGLVFASSAQGYARAIAATLAPDVPVVLTQGSIAGRRCLAFDELLAKVPTADVDARLAAVGPDTIAKFLFTSGSTGEPKGVINTQRMLCSNQQAVTQLWPFLGEKPPVILDWLPGTTPSAATTTSTWCSPTAARSTSTTASRCPASSRRRCANLREMSPTIYFNVPHGFER